MLWCPTDASGAALVRNPMVPPPVPRGVALQRSRARADSGGARSSDLANPMKLPIATLAGSALLALASMAPSTPATLAIEGGGSSEGGGDPIAALVLNVIKGTMLDSPNVGKDRFDVRGTFTSDQPVGELLPLIADDLQVAIFGTFGQQNQLPLQELPHTWKIKNGKLTYKSAPGSGYSILLEINAVKSTFRFVANKIELNGNPGPDVSFLLFGAGTLGFYTGTWVQKKPWLYKTQ